MTWHLLPTTMHPEHRATARILKQQLAAKDSWWRFSSLRDHGLLVSSAQALSQEETLMRWCLHDFQTSNLRSEEWGRVSHTKNLVRIMCPSAKRESFAGNASPTDWELAIVPSSRIIAKSKVFLEKIKPSLTWKRHFLHSHFPATELLSPCSWDAGSACLLLSTLPHSLTRRYYTATARQVPSQGGREKQWTQCLSWRNAATYCA